MSFRDFDPFLGIPVCDLHASVLINITKDYSVEWRSELSSMLIFSVSTVVDCLFIYSSFFPKARLCFELILPFNVLAK